MTRRTNPFFGLTSGRYRRIVAPRGRPVFSGSSPTMLGPPSGGLLHFGLCRRASAKTSSAEHDETSPQSNAATRRSTSSAQATSISESGVRKDSSIDSATFARSSALSLRAWASICFRSGFMDYRLPPSSSRKPSRARTREGKKATAGTPAATHSLHHRTRQPNSPSHRASA